MKGGRSHATSIGFCLSVATTRVKMDSYLNVQHSCPTQRERIFLESRHWDRQDPITTGTMFGGTILHTHAQKPFETIQYMYKTCICDREGFSAQSTFHL